MSLDYFGKKENNQQRDYNSGKNRIPPKEIYDFKGEKAKTAHHQRHVTEFGYKSSREYVLGAQQFWKLEVGDVYYSVARDCFYKYDSKSERLLVVSSDGTIHTYMPKSRKEFWRTERWDKLEKI